MGRTETPETNGTHTRFGCQSAEAALARRDKGAATARDTTTPDDLSTKYGEHVPPLALDVTGKSAVDSAVARAHEHFGRLDVVGNNTGYGFFGAIEEVGEEPVRAQIETNLFGALWVTQAVVPILR